MFSFCVLTVSLVFANGWVIGHPRARRESPSQCVTRVLGQCSPAYIVFDPDELFENGNLILDCSNETLREEQVCANSLAACRSFQSEPFAIMMVLKLHICAQPYVYKSGRACWNEMRSEDKSVELSSCGLCPFWTCYRDHLDAMTCPDEQLKFMADLNRAVVTAVHGTC